MPAGQHDGPRDAPATSVGLSPLRVRGSPARPAGGDFSPRGATGTTPDHEVVDMEGGRSIGARLAQGDERALEEAYTAYGPSLLGYLRRYVGDNEAEDALQRTFVEVWRSARRYDPAQRFESWLFTIAHRRAVDELRKRRHPVVDVDTVRDLVGEDGRETAEQHADAAEVRAALQRLPDHEREVLELAYFGALTLPEVAVRLDAPLGTVKARAARGTRRLGDVLRAQRDQGVRHEQPV